MSRGDSHAQTHEPPRLLNRIDLYLSGVCALDQSRVSNPERVGLLLGGCLHEHPPNDPPRGRSVAATGYGVNSARPAPFESGEYANVRVLGLASDIHPDRCPPGGGRFEGLCRIHMLDFSHESIRTPEIA